MVLRVVRSGTLADRARSAGVHPKTLRRREALALRDRAQLSADPPIDPSDPAFADAPFTIGLKRGRWGAEVDSPHPAFNSLASLKAYCRASDDPEVRRLVYSNRH